MSGSEHLGPMPMPGDAAVGPAPFVSRTAPTAVTGSSKFRRTSAAIAASASRAWRPEALTSIWSPFGTPSVESALTLRPLTVGPPVLRLRTVTSASKRRTVSTNRAAGRACRPWSLCRVSSMLATGPVAAPWSGASGVPMPSSLVLMCPA